MKPLALYFKNIIASVAYFIILTFLVKHEKGFRK